MPGKGHFTCDNCGQSFRFPAGSEIDFDYKTCGRAFSVTKNGTVYVDVQSTALTPQRFSNTLQQAMPAKRKGFFDTTGDLLDSTLEAAAGANEQAHGNRLRSDLIDTLGKVNYLAPSVAESARTRFMQLTIELRQ